MLLNPEQLADSLMPKPLSAYLLTVLLNPEHLADQCDAPKPLSAYLLTVLLNI